MFAIAISVYYDEIDKKNPGLNINNIDVPPKMKDIEQFEKDNPDISVTIFEYGFEKIKEDENNIKEGIKINDVRVSPFALKRNHLVELLIIKEKVKDEIKMKLLKNHILLQKKKFIKIISRIKI